MRRARAHRRTGSQPKTNSGVSDDPEESWWPYNDPFARENPVPPDERPKYPTCRGADGASAGDINLFVQMYQFPSTGPCLILNGSDGSMAKKEISKKGSALRTSR